MSEKETVLSRLHIFQTVQCCALVHDIGKRSHVRRQMACETNREKAPREQNTYLDR